MTSQQKSGGAGKSKHHLKSAQSSATEDTSEPATKTKKFSLASAQSSKSDMSSDKDIFALAAHSMFENMQELFRRQSEWQQKQQLQQQQQQQQHKASFEAFQNAFFPSM